MVKGCHLRDLICVLLVRTAFCEGETEGCDVRYAALEKKYRTALKKLEKTRRERDALLELVLHPNGRPGGEIQPEHIDTILGDPAIAAVRPSGMQGAGRGSFAMRDFEVGTVVGQFKCVVLPDDGRKDKTRAWFLNETHICDGKHVPLNNPMLYVNSILSGDTCARQNVAVDIPTPDRIVYVAEKRIQAGDELFVDYSKRFFLNLGAQCAPPMIYTCNMPVLHSVSALGDVGGVRRLLADSAAQDLEDGSKRVNEASAEEGWTALMEASYFGHRATVDLLIQQGAEVDAVVEEWCYAVEDKLCRMTSLHLACRKGHVSVLWSLFAARAKIDGPETVEGVSPLLSVARMERGHVDIVTALLNARADKDKVSSDGVTPLSAASIAGHVNIVSALLSANTNIGGSGEDDEIPLLKAAQAGHVNVVEVLLHARASADTARVKDGATALFIASRNGFAGIANLLIGANASKDHVTTGGSTPLFMAAQSSHVEVVNLLLEANADKDKPCSYGASALHVASQDGHIGVVRALLERRAKTDQSIDDGATPLYMAAESGHVDSVQALLEAGANAKKKTLQGATPLLIAAVSGHAEVVKSLLQSGVKQSPAANGGHNIIELAQGAGHSAVIEVLSQAGKREL